MSSHRARAGWQKYYPRKNSEGKKIGFKDGIRAIICIWKY